MPVATEREVDRASSESVPPGVVPLPDERSARPGRWRHLADMGTCDRRTTVPVALGIVAVWAVAAGWWMPRGPLSTAHAVWSIVLGVLVGAAVGFAARSRWAMLATPALFAVVFEVVRLGTDGPTVDGFHLSTYGILAFVVGRGFHALVSLLPMVWGAAIGAGAARHLDPARTRGSTPGHVARAARRTVAVLAGFGLIAFSIALLRPASTDAIVDTDGREVVGSIAELSTVEVNGHEFSMMIRGHSVGNPVLLFLAGGPGGSELGAMRNHLPDLERHVTVVTWDQRGTGTSYVALDPVSTLTPDAAVADALAVTDHLRDRFGQDRIYLVGQSWGTILGVLAVQQAPEKFHAFVGTGQMVSPVATDRIFYDDTLAWARAGGDDGLVDDLIAIGPPPYSSILDYETALSYEHEVYPYDHSPNSEGQGGFSENFFVDEYRLIDQVHLLAGFMETFTVLYPQLQDIDFRNTATEFDVPMYFVQGAHEADGRADPFAEWYPMVDAPIKDLTVLDTSGHRPLFEQPQEFTTYMVGTVLAGTSEG